MKTWQEQRQDGAQSIAKSMMDIYRIYQEKAATGYAQRGFKGLTLAHAHFLAQVDEAGTHISAIAKGLGNTKQYAGRLARELQTNGLVDAVADPTDRRAVLIRPTRRAMEFFECAAEVRQGIERWFMDRLGPELSSQFAQILQKLCD